MTKNDIKKFEVYKTVVQQTGEVKKKLEQMTFAANSFMKFEKMNQKYMLAVGTVENGNIDWFEVD